MHKCSSSETKRVRTASVAFLRPWIVGPRPIQRTLWYHTPLPVAGEHFAAPVLAAVIAQPLRLRWSAHAARSKLIDVVDTMIRS